MSMKLYEGKANRFLILNLHILTTDRIDDSNINAVIMYLLKTCGLHEGHFNSNEDREKFFQNIDYHLISCVEDTRFFDIPVYDYNVIVKFESKSYNRLSSFSSGLSMIGSRGKIPSDYTVEWRNVGSYSFKNIYALEGRVVTFFTMDYEFFMRSDRYYRDDNNFQHYVNFSKNMKKMQPISQRHMIRIGSLGGMKKSINLLKQISVGDYYNANEEIVISLEEDLKSAIQDRENDLWIKSVGLYSRDFLLARVQSSLQIKYDVYYDDNTAIITDSKKGYNCIKDKMHQFLALRHYDWITITQYNIDKILSVWGGTFVLDGQSLQGAERDTILHIAMPNKDKLSGQAVFDDYRHYLSGGIIEEKGINFSALYPVKTRRAKTLKIVNTVLNDYCYRDLGIESMILPYSMGEDLADQALKLFMEVSNREEDIAVARGKYMGIISDIEEGQPENDVLTRWFNQVTVTADLEHKQLIQGYERLKKDLIKQYKDITLYLNHIDLSKKQPIPQIVTDKRVLKHFSKGNCHADYELLDTTRIGGEAIPQKIIEQKLFVKYIGDYKHRGISVKCIPIKDIFDPKTNTIYLTSETVKKGRR